ncbi:MAG: ribonucleotide-diphosphate reductase subunit beta [Candidatus Pacebacteria bacterium]|nr:ribonucleotide-diphosphate reductase subunit beta [Candidatus Paceibacterota bacterium]
MLIGIPEEKDYNIYPSTYSWAREMYEQAVANTWFPKEVPLKEDLDDLQSMTEDEVDAVKFIMSFMNPAELVVNRSIALGIYPYIKSAECHLFIAKWLYEEANHCMTFEYMLETFPWDRDEIYGKHLITPAMQAKEKFVQSFTERMTSATLDISSPEGKKDFIRNLVATNVIMEGVWFYSGFMVMLSFRQRNKLRNFGSLINWIIRDESLHLKFGMTLLLTILEENASLITEEFATEIRDLIVRGVDLEIAYNHELFPNGILGLNADYVNQYVKYVADRRLEELGFETHYNVQNPAKWMATSTDVLELVNFFEQQNTNYEVNTSA